MQNYLKILQDINNNTGIFQVSVRRQNDCMVSGGYMMVGDSAWMPKPIDAGGIGPALIAGTILGNNVAQALEANDDIRSITMAI